MRARNIKPGFFKNEILHLELGAIHAILFEGLWCLSDKAGKLEDRPLRIKAECLPYYNVEIENLLSELEQKKFIIRYSVNGNKYIKIIHFEDHQHPHVTEKESNIPEPINNVKQRKKYVKHTLVSDNNPPDLLIPDSSNTDSCGQSEFEIFWKSYPRKKNRGQAEKAWERLKPNAELKEKIIKKVDELKKCQDWIKDGGKWIPYPATWLNAKGWEDEIEINKSTEPVEPVKYIDRDGSIGEWDAKPK